MSRSNVRRYHCEDCGEFVARVRNYAKSNVCFACGVARADQAARDMFYRTGPAWVAHQRNPGGRPRKAPPPTE